MKVTKPLLVAAVASTFGCVSTQTYTCLGQSLEVEDTPTSLILHDQDGIQEVEKSSPAHRIFTTFCKPT